MSDQTANALMASAAEVIRQAEAAILNLRAEKHELARALRGMLDLAELASGQNDASAGVRATLRFNHRARQARELLAAIDRSAA